MRRISLKWIIVLKKLLQFKIGRYWQPSLDNSKNHGVFIAMHADSMNKNIILLNIEDVRMQQLYFRPGSETWTTIAYRLIPRPLLIESTVLKLFIHEHN